jgi:Nif-specific regulatory protein
MLSRVLDLALEIVKAERGLIILVDPDTEKQEVRAARGVEPETIADALEYSRSVVKEAAAGRTMLLLDSEADQQFRRYKSISLFHIKSLACVPMRVRERIVGTVYLDSRRQGYPFGEEEMEFLKAFANLAAAALEIGRLNARLSSENVTLEREVQDLRKAAARRTRYQNIIGRNVRMQAVYDLLERVSASNLPVLITGESGTGKELVARAIHFGGPRRDRRIFSENVAALTDTLLESELFGHVRGAFTGADRDRKGVFELANGGTLFLDEIGDMSLAMQSKVLRALQEGEVRPVGGRDAVRVDVRIISATNRDLETMMREGRFREDLYYRLNVVRIAVPPLRERKEDIPLLIEHFLERAAETAGVPRKRLDISALQLLVRYDWPGNVRELENEIMKLVVLTNGDVVTQQDIASNRELIDKLTRLEDDREKEAEGFQRLAQMEKRQIERALAKAGGNRAKAAQMLGISRATIYRKLQEFGIS